MTESSESEQLRTVRNGFSLKKPRWVVARHKNSDVKPACDMDWLCPRPFTRRVQLCDHVSKLSWCLRNGYLLR